MPATRPPREAYMQHAAPKLDRWQRRRGARAEECAPVHTFASGRVLLISCLAFVNLCVCACVGGRAVGAAARPHTLGKLSCPRLQSSRLASIHEAAPALPQARGEGSSGTPVSVSRSCRFPSSHLAQTRIHTTPTPFSFIRLKGTQQQQQQNAQRRRSRHGQQRRAPRRRDQDVREEEESKAYRAV